MILEDAVDNMVADAQRYRYLRNHCYQLRNPKSEFDLTMELKFTVSGIWSDNQNPEVLDKMIDKERN